MAGRNSGAVLTAYNPQEWGRNGPVGGAYVPHSTSASRARGTREATGMEANLPSPPPPYTQTASIAAESMPPPNLSPPVAGPSSFAPPLDHNDATQHSALYASPNSSFPPPPPNAQRDRSGSRTRGMFSLLTSRPRQGENLAQPENLSRQRVEGSNRLSMQPAPVKNVTESPLAPPASRRAASTGSGPAALGNTRQSSNQGRRGSNAAWEPGMPLPPPPPGPPPASRSQSVDRASDRGFGSSADAVPSLAAPIPTRIAQLGAIPPTPADWVDEEARTSSESSQASTTGLRLNTDVAQTNNVENSISNLHIMSATEPGQVFETSTGGRGRMFGFRPTGDTSAKGIRERRSEARAYRASSREPKSAVEDFSTSLEVELESAKPADLVLALGSDGIARKPRVIRAQASPLTGTSNASAGRGGPAQENNSSTSTPVINHQDAAQGDVRRGSAATPTPPFSGGKDTAELRLKSGQFLPASGRALLPTPPILSSGANSVVSPLTRSDSAAGTTSLTNRERQLSSSPNSFKSPTSANSLAALVSSPLSTLGDNFTFAQDSLERHRIFAEKEAAAVSDLERLELFAAFVVHESRLRRDRYADAFDSLGSDVLDLTRDLWRTYSATKRARTPNSAADASRSTPRPQSRDGPETPVQPSSAGSASSSVQPFTPVSESDHGGNGATLTRHRSDPQKLNSFQPCLSPIPSMAMSTATDEESSRGRASSRWWEGSVKDSSIAGGAIPRVERSKRESKYMGVHPEAREHLQWDNAEASPSYYAASGSMHPYASLGPDEYPVEKMGWQGQGTPSTASSFTRGGQLTPQPSVQRSPKLDVSRLITLPPPYPRHHPALNNSHPKLATLRATLRSLCDRGDVVELKERYLAASPPHTRGDSSTSVAERRRELRSSIQEKVTRGAMSFAEAAKAEAEFDEYEVKKSREDAQKQFDSFQSKVMSPLSSIFSDKTTKATAAIEQLSRALKDDAQFHDPNQTQEEGDETPELLERVTLMKWLFEAREQLQKELFELQSESDEKYKQVILAPYRASGNQEKVREVEAFFKKDTQDRKVKHESNVLKRYEALLPIVEEHIARGVENQLSAFWDIAPSLLAVVQKVPQHLHGFDIQIPQHEYDENPSYHEFPMQYLFSLVLHAEKSAYQFIESQTNQSCLLHEVKSAVVLAGCKNIENQQSQAGDDAATVEREISTIRDDEDARLTADLKERVQLAENQWKDALGYGLEECKTRIRTFLMDVGGWDESLEE